MHRLIGRLRMFRPFDRRRAVREPHDEVTVAVTVAVQYSQTAIRKANRLIDELGALEVVIIPRMPNGPQPTES